MNTATAIFAVLVVLVSFVFLLKVLEHYKRKQEEKKMVVMIKKRFRNEPSRQVLQEYLVWICSWERLTEDFVDFYFKRKAVKENGISK